MAKILVIDDYAPLRGLLESRLSIEGHEVSTAADGEDGLRLAGRVVFDLALIDVDLPGMDGMAVCSDLKGNSLTWHMKVLMMTGRPGWEVEIRARLAGASSVLAKPFLAGTLLDAIRVAAGSDIFSRQAGAG